MRSPDHGLYAPAPVHAGQIRSGDPYEISNGRLVYCAPTGGQGSKGNQLGASVVGWDPAVREIGVDTGYSPKPSMLRAPDVAVGNVPDKPGWVKGAPELAIEYADTGQDEDELKKKIAELLDAGTRYLWVVRLVGMRRVEVHEPKKRMRTFLPGDVLTAPGVLKNPVRVEALYDRDAAEKATLTNLLQRAGYDDLEGVLARGRHEGRVEGWAEGREEGSVLAKRDALRRVLEHKKLGVTAAIARQIDGCSDEKKLDGWFERALGAARIEDVFTSPKRPRKK